MEELTILEEKKKALLEELLNLDDFRKGSLVEQYFEKKLADNSIIRLGPYALYTYKEGGRTISARITQPILIERYKAEINEFRKFERICAELVLCNQTICDLKIKQQKTNSSDLKKKRQR